MILELRTDRPWDLWESDPSHASGVAFDAEGGAIYVRIAPAGAPRDEWPAVRRVARDGSVRDAGRDVYLVLFPDEVVEVEE